MSVKGLEESEKIAAKIQKNVLKSLKKQKLELEDELAKVQYLLSDPEALKGWRTALAGPERVSALYAMLDETEKLYLEAGDTEAARIFRRRMEAQLKQKLTNIKANKIEVEVRIAKSKIEMQGHLQNGFTEVRREGALREMYNQARGNGGFFANFGRPYLTDLVTLETKAAGSKTIGEYMSNLYNQYEAGLKNVFINGIIRGDSYQTMQNNLMRTTDITEGKAKLLIRTESNAIFNQSVLDVINDNPLVKGYRFRAVLDSHTSKICQEHDGRFIPKDEVQPGVNYPPLHPNCRSTVTTVLVDEDEKQDTMQRYTKNDKNQWEKVPPGMAYQEYKDKFGFSDSKKSRPYDSLDRDVRDPELADLCRVRPASYRGYVKPSRSASARIDKMVKAYQDGDTSYIEKLKANTGFSDVKKAMLRQAQAESGYDGLPLRLTKAQFDKQVTKNEYRVLYRQFGKEEDLQSFLEGNQMYGTGQSNYGAGTYAFEQEPTDNRYGRKQVRLALRTPEEKILKVNSLVDSQIDIANAQTPDERINQVLRTVPEESRRDLISVLATQYGYDAIEVTAQSSRQYMLILNRSAVLVDEPVTVVNEVLPEESKVPSFRSTYVREDYIAPNDSRIVVKGNTKVVEGVIASASKIDGVVPRRYSNRVRAIYENAKKAEVKATDALLNVTDKIEGVRLDELEFSAKTATSYVEKIPRVIERAAKNNVVMTEEQAAESMTDLVRYTIATDENSLVSATKKAKSMLEDQGFELKELTNKFNDPEYKGISMKFMSPDGTVVEVQVNTEEALKIKPISHELYEQSRKPGTSKEEKEEISRRLRALWSSVKVPKDIDEIKNKYWVK